MSCGAGHSRPFIIFGEFFQSAPKVPYPPSSIADDASVSLMKIWHVNANHIQIWECILDDNGNRVRLLSFPLINNRFFIITGKTDGALGAVAALGHGDGNPHVGFFRVLVDINPVVGTSIVSIGKLFTVRNPFNKRGGSGSLGQELAQYSDLPRLKESVDEITEAAKETTLGERLSNLELVMTAAPNLFVGFIKLWHGCGRSLSDMIRDPDLQHRLFDPC